MDNYFWKAHLTFIIVEESVKLVCQFARNELREELFPRPEPANAKKKGKKDKKGGGKGKKGGKKGAEQVLYHKHTSDESGNIFEEFSFDSAVSSLRVIQRAIIETKTFEIQNCLL